MNLEDGSFIPLSCPHPRVMDQAKVERYVVGLLEQHCGPRVAQDPKTRLHFVNAILTGAATPDIVCAQIEQLGQHLQQTPPSSLPARSPPPAAAPVPSAMTRSVWTREEQKRGVEGYERFGADVGKIQAHVGTRSAEEVMTFLADYTAFLESKQAREKERAIQERMRQVEQQLQRERSAMSNDRNATARDDSREQARLQRETKDDRAREDELVRRLQQQTLEEPNQGEALHLQLAERQRALEMEQRIAFLQQQIKAEKAKGSHGVPTTQALSRPSSFPTVPQQHQKQEPEILFDPFAPTPTSSTSALFPSTAHLDHPTTSLPQMQMPLPTAQPAQPNSRAKQQQQQPLQQPTPTMMDDYERLFNNVPFSLSSSSQSTVPQSPLHTAQSKQQQPMEQQQQRQQQQQKHKQPQGPNPEEAACLAEYEQLFNNVPLPTSSSSAQPQISAALPVPSSKASTSSSSLHSKAPGAGAAPAASPALPPPDMIPDITPISSSSKGGSGGKYDFDQVKEYVTELYRVYTGGKLPDPATFRWYIESIMNGSYSLAQAGLLCLCTSSSLC